MSITSTPLTLVAGLLVGLALACLHAWLARRAVDRLLAGGPSWRLVAGYPLRVSVPALGLAALAGLSLAGLLAGTLAFVLGQRLVLRRGAV
jgi:hypothetical protein